MRKSELLVLSLSVKKAVFIHENMFPFPLSKFPGQIRLQVI